VVKKLGFINYYVIFIHKFDSAWIELRYVSMHFKNVPYNIHTFLLLGLGFVINMYPFKKL